MSNKVNQLQEQVDALFANMNALRSEAFRLAPIQDRSTAALPSASSTPSTSSMPSITPAHRVADLPQPRPPGFRGPTSTRFSLDVAKNTLHKMGYSNPSDAGDPDGFVQDTPAPSPNMPVQMVNNLQGSARDPLWEFDKDELVRLCRVHDEEVGIMYPVVKIESVIRHARTLSSWMEAAKKNFMVPLYGEEGGIKDQNTLLLKIIVCCAMQVEEHSNSEKAQRLFSSVRPTTDRMLMSDPSDVKNMPILALVVSCILSFWHITLISRYLYFPLFTFLVYHASCVSRASLPRHLRFVEARLTCKGGLLLFSQRRNLGLAYHGSSNTSLLRAGSSPKRRHPTN